MDYKIVKYCPFCKERFTVERSAKRQYLCDKCEKRFEKKD